MLEIVMLSAAVLFQTGDLVEPVEEKPVELEMLAIDLRALSRIAEVSDDPGKDARLMRRIVNDRIEELRQRRSDGSYRWASLQREEASRDTKEEEVERVHTEELLDTVTLDAREAYRVEIELPQKKSLFSSNDRVFVRRISVSGPSGTPATEIPASVWISPGNSWGVALPEIMTSGDVTVELGVETGKKDAVAKVSVLRAKLVDDPKSPYYAAVTKLVDIRDELHGSIDRGGLQRSIDEAIATVPGEVETTLRLEQARAEERMRRLETGELSGSVHPGDATPDTVDALRHISRNLEGTLQEQQDARERLQRLIESLTLPAPPDTMPE